MVLSFYMVSEGESLRTFFIFFGVTLVVPAETGTSVLYHYSWWSSRGRSRYCFMALWAMDIWRIYFHLFKVSKGAVGSATRRGRRAAVTLRYIFRRIWLVLLLGDWLRYSLYPWKMDIGLRCRYILCAGWAGIAVPQCPFRQDSSSKMLDVWSCTQTLQFLLNSIVTLQVLCYCLTELTFFIVLSLRKSFPGGKHFLQIC